MTLLQVSDLEKTYGGKKVVNELCFSVDEGKVVGLLGPNGAGKTTAFYMTMGLIRPDRGSVTFMGEEVTNKPVYMRAQMGMGYLAQEPSVFKSLTVEQNILCVLETLCLSKAEREKRLSELLQELHLEPLAKRKAASLSGGERRRVEITRALVTRPKLLLLDEPFANIDPLAVQEVKELISHLTQRGISVLITDHNAREIFSIVDKSYLVREGKAILSGTPKQLLASPEARRVYFGENFHI